MRHIITRAVGLLLCIAVVSSMAAAPAAATEDHEEFTVELDAEGNADVSVSYAFDLDSDDEQAAFEELQDNTTTQEEFVDRFENRMTAVAEDANDETDREMSVGDAEITFETVDDVGVVTLSLQWEHLAAVDGDQLTVTEPFASGFEPDRTFTVTAPDDYEITSATPEPSTSGEASASWEAGASLDGFELVAEPLAADDETDDETGETEDDGTGFGVVAALVGLLAAAAVARLSE